MKIRDRHRPAAALLIAIAAAVGLAACGSSDASDVTAVPPISTAATAPESTVAGATTAPATTLPVATTTAAVVAATQVAPPATDAPTTTDNALIVSDAEVADLEKQLDEIDQLLAGVDADLSQD